MARWRRISTLQYYMVRHITTVSETSVVDSPVDSSVAVGLDSISLPVRSVMMTHHLLFFLLSSCR